MDPRIERAQQLYWEITRLTDLGAYRMRRSKLIEMAQMHEERALELLEEGDPDGWVDLFAAITAWAKAGCREDVGRLVAAGRSAASQSGSGEATIHRAIGRTRGVGGRLDDDDCAFAPGLRPAFAQPAMGGSIGMKTGAGPKIIGFYAYKGGTGRTFCLAHTAWALARDGWRIAVIDLDLSAPSLGMLFGKPPAPGLVEYVTHWNRRKPVQVSDLIEEVPLDPKASGALFLLQAGKMDQAYLDALADAGLAGVG